MKNPRSLRKAIEEIVKIRAPQKAWKKIAKRHGIKLIQIGRGADRVVFLIRGTSLVLKIDIHECFNQTPRELKRVRRFQKIPKLRPFLPKIYFRLCRVTPVTSVVVMRYYPNPSTLEDVDRLDKYFRRYVYDVHEENVRRTRSGQAKLIDLGV